MADVTRMLEAIEAGDPHAACELMPLVYDELRKLAAHKLAHEKPGQTLDATALVHEAYLRLVQSSPGQASGAASARRELHWANRAHFFAAAAEAMRRILVEQARHKQSLKAGGDRQRIDLANVAPAIAPPCDDLLAIDEALAKLEQKDKRKADLVKLRFFAGLTLDEAADALGISPSTADNDWAYARAWLRVAIDGEAD